MIIIIQSDDYVSELPLKRYQSKYRKIPFLLNYRVPITALSKFVNRER